MKHIAIVGSRGFGPLSLVRDFVDALAIGTVVLSGGAHGVDQEAEQRARQRGLDVCVFLPNYDAHGAAAPKARNTLIVNAADSLVAFWDGRSGGTYDSICKARRRRIPFVIFGQNGKTINLLDKP